MPDEDIDSARKAYEWPKRFADVLREAGTKAAAEHRQFEAALKARRKEFDKRVEQYAAELALVEGRNDIVKREVVASEVSWRRTAIVQVLAASIVWHCLDTAPAMMQVACYQHWLNSKHSLKDSHSRRGVVCCGLQVADLQAKLQAAVAEAEVINNQEKMFGWALTKCAAACR